MSMTSPLSARRRTSSPHRSGSWSTASSGRHAFQSCHLSAFPVTARNDFKMTSSGAETASTALSFGFTRRRASAPSRNRHSTLTVAPYKLKEERDDLGQQHVLIEQDRALRHFE